MATYQSRDEVIEGYRSLLKLERRLSKCFEQEDVDADLIGDILEKQDEIMTAIDEAPNLDQQVLNDDDSSAHDLLEEFSRLRSDNRSLMEQYVEELESALESLDQAHELLKHYLQGEPRSGEEPSRRFDKEV